MFLFLMIRINRSKKIKFGSISERTKSMHQIRIHSERNITTGFIKKGKVLLDCIRESGFDIYSPCGGKGTCGKCNVYIQGMGEFAACRYIVNHDLEIVLPDRKQLNILSSQYENSIELPLNPGTYIKQYSNPHGIAIDLGTTTMVFYLMNLHSGSLLQSRTVANPQAKYGADVISRINFCLLHKKGLDTLQNELVRSINDVVGIFSESESITTDDIVRITVTGNTTMFIY